ncbi:hypothetical protein QQ045_023063 [Rhodiola kirilowii]
MGKGKLILICQYGGEFIKKDDGIMLYTGGDANAINITRETPFEDLKLELAEMWNLDTKSVSIKYFLSGNRRTLINIRNEKDLKRMMEFHKDFVSTDLFVFGKEGFSQDALNSYTARDNGIKAAKTVSKIGASTPIVSQKVTVPTNPFPVPDTVPAASPTLIDVSISLPDELLSNIVQNVSSFSNATDLYDENESSDDADSLYNVPIRTNASQKRVATVMDDSPADTVKKRRRTSSWKIGVNGCLTLANPNYALGIEELERQDEALVEGDMDLPMNPVDSSSNSLDSVVSSWKGGIVGVGQEFKSAKEFRDALQKYAVANRFVYKLKKNDSSRVSGRCVVAECSWSIHASWVQSLQVFVIKKMNSLHTCEGESWKSAHPGKNWLVSVIKEKLQDTLHPKPKEIAKSLLHDFGIQLNYSQVWRGIEDARGLLQGSLKEAYNQLPWLCERIVSTNPGSVVKLNTHDDKRFQRLFVSLQPLILGFQNGCRPLIFLDSVSLKSKYHEMLLFASAVDGADECFPIAYSIVDEESSDNWLWFLQQLKLSISTSRPITFVSDREVGVKKPVFEVFNDACVGYSLFHLLESFKKSLVGPFKGDGKGSLPGYFISAAQAVRVDCFKKATEQIRQVSSVAYEWIMQSEPECWANALFNGERYSHITRNVGAEFHSKLTNKVPDLPINQKIHAFTSLIIDMMSTRKRDSANWSSKLTPPKEEQIRAEIAKSLGLKVFHSSNMLSEVHDDGNNHVVNIDTRDCTCLDWKKSGLPCRHAIAVFSSKGLNLYNYCQQWFSVETYQLAYTNSINPLMATEQIPREEIDAPVQVAPPATATPRQQKQAKTQKEPKRTVVCTNCKEPGHNKVTCIKS